MNRRLVTVSKFLAKHLRHAPEALGLTLEPGGWVCRERRLPYSRDFDPDVLRVDNYIPFNTLLVERRLFDEAGAFDTSLPFFEDWDFLIRLSAITSFHHRPQVTCEYRHFRGGGHHVFGERPRERSDFLEVKARVLAKHADPKMAAPETSADPQGNIPAAHNMFYFRDPEQVPRYITWNGELAAAIQDRAGVVNSLLIRTETSPVLLGLKEGAAPDAYKKVRLESFNSITKAGRKAAYWTAGIARAADHGWLRLNVAPRFGSRSGPAASSPGGGTAVRYADVKINEEFPAGTFDQARWNDIPIPKG